MLHFTCYMLPVYIHTSYNNKIHLFTICTKMYRYLRQQCQYQHYLLHLSILISILATVPRTIPLLLLHVHMYIHVTYLYIHVILLHYLLLNLNLRVAPSDPLFGGGGGGTKGIVGTRSGSGCGQLLGPSNQAGA